MRASESDEFYLSTCDVHVAIMTNHYISTRVKIYELHGNVSWTFQKGDEGPGWGSVQLSAERCLYHNVYHSQPNLKNFRIGVRKSTGKTKEVSCSIFLTVYLKWVILCAFSIRIPG